MIYCDWNRQHLCALILWVNNFRGDRSQQGRRDRIAQRLQQRSAVKLPNREFLIQDLVSGKASLRNAYGAHEWPLGEGEQT